MKKIILAILLSLAALPMVAQESRLAENYTLEDGTKIVNTNPYPVYYDNQFCFLRYGYVGNTMNEIYSFSIVCTGQEFPWVVSMQDLAEFHSITNGSIYLAPLFDSEATLNKDKYNVTITYLIPKPKLQEMLTAFDKIIIRGKYQNQQFKMTLPITFECAEHLMLGYLELLDQTGK